MEIDKILNTINHRKKVLFFFFLGITGSILIFVYFILRRSVLTPVYELVNGYNEVSRGNLNIKVNVMSKDEIGMLTRSFNEMVKNLNIQQRAIIQSEKLASIGTLTAEIAHRINNPLAIIMMRVEHLLDLLKREDLSKSEREKIIKDLQVILKHGNDISTTVNNLLNISRVSKNDITEIPLNNLIKEIVDFVDRITLKKGIRINAQFDSLSPIIQCNRDDIRQVFLSIIFNAIDALEEKSGGDTKRIEVRIQPIKEEKLCQITVKDNGVGIPPQYLDKIFDPFFTTKESGKGTGLGLTIAYNIIQGIGGKIWAESKVNEGTSFYIQVPVIRFEDASS